MSNYSKTCLSFCAHVKIALGAAAALLFSVSLCSAAQTAPASSADELQLKQKLQSATAGLKDVTLTVRIAYENQQELEKIGKDFGMAYKFSSSKLEFKFPDKFKMTGKTGLMNVTYLVTGTTRRVKAGFVNKTEDISQKPHKRRSALDVGLVDPSIWTQYHIDSVSLTTDDQRPVYLVVMARSNALHKKIKLYIDASQMRLMKRENFEDDGSLIARYIYSKHRSFDGFLLPTEIRVYNEDEKLAGTSEYTSVQVNTGLPDSTFK